MREYISIGNDHLRDFYRSWESKFNEFEEESLAKISEYESIHEE